MSLFYLFIHTYGIMKQSSNSVALPKHATVTIEVLINKISKDLCIMKPTQHKILA